jgi:NAD+ diphosphatase
MDFLMPFSGNPLDRASVLREDEAWITQQLASGEGRFLVLSKLEVLTHPGETPALAWLDAGLRERLGLETIPVLLGMRNSIPHFALDVSEHPDPLASLGLNGAAFAEPRGLATTLPAGDAGIVAQARSLIDWHARHRFCGACGGPTVPRKGGAHRACEQCGAHVFPRIDPSVIMVVWREDQCLLGRRRGRPPGSFSCLAGYIEQGETIEEAVAREVLEEVGLKVDNVHYVASQPWPFPSTLMIGCFAHASDSTAKPDEVEIQEARWFGRAEVRAALAGEDVGLTVPAPVAIAHHIIRRWAEEATLT